MKEALGSSATELNFNGQVLSMSEPPVDRDPVLAGSHYRRFFLLHSSSSSRLTAGAANRRPDDPGKVAISCST